MITDVQALVVRAADDLIAGRHLVGLACGRL
jgi:hypothetical protein